MHNQLDNAQYIDEESQFELMKSDVEAIRIMKAVAYRLIRHPKITPAGIVGLGRALYALGRLPESTPGVSVRYEACYRNGGESESVELSIDDESISIREGGVANSGFGSDCYETGKWGVALGGYRESNMEFYLIEETVAELLNLGEPYVEDNSSIEIEDEE